MMLFETVSLAVLANHVLWNSFSWMLCTAVVVGLAVYKICALLQKNGQGRRVDDDVEATRLRYALKNMGHKIAAIERQFDVTFIYPGLKSSATSPGFASTTGSRKNAGAALSALQRLCSTVEVTSVELQGLSALSFSQNAAEVLPVKKFVEHVECSVRYKDSKLSCKLLTGDNQFASGVLPVVFEELGGEGEPPKPKSGTPVHVLKWSEVSTHPSALLTLLTHGSGFVDIFLTCEEGDLAKERVVMDITELLLRNESRLSVTTVLRTPDPHVLRVIVTHFLASNLAQPVFSHDGILKTALGDPRPGANPVAPRPISVEIIDKQLSTLGGEDVKISPWCSASATVKLCSDNSHIWTGAASKLRSWCLRPTEEAVDLSMPPAILLPSICALASKFLSEVTLRSSSTEVVIRSYDVHRPAELCCALLTEAKQVLKNGVQNYHLAAGSQSADLPENIRLLIAYAISKHENVVVLRGKDQSECFRMEIPNAKLTVNLGGIKVQGQVTPGNIDIVANAKAGMIPAEWNSLETDNVLKFVVLGSHWPEYLSVMNCFGSAPDVRITKIERVENVPFYQKFAINLQLWKESASSAVCKTLFHGTTVDSSHKICASGFDRTYAGSALGMAFGKGSYFAADIRTPLGIAQSRQGCILVCDVIVGNIVQGSKGFYPAEPFVTAVNRLSSPSVFVTFKDEVAYPKYRVFIG